MFNVGWHRTASPRPGPAGRPERVCSWAGRPGAVIDTQAGILRRYFDPLNHPATPVQDTSAFATCP